MTASITPQISPASLNRSVDPLTLPQGFVRAVASVDTRNAKLPPPPPLRTTPLQAHLVPKPTQRQEPSSPYFISPKGIRYELPPLPPRTPPSSYLTADGTMHQLPFQVPDSVDFPTAPPGSTGAKDVFNPKLEDFSRNFEKEAINRLFNVALKNKQVELHKIFNESRNSAAKLNIIDFAILYRELSLTKGDDNLDKIANKYISEILKDKLGADSAFGAWTDDNKARYRNLKRLGNELCDLTTKKNRGDILALGNFLKVTDVKSNILANVENSIKEPLNADAIKRWEGTIDRVAKQALDALRQNVATMIEKNGPSIELYSRDLKLVAKLPELLRPILAEIVDNDSVPTDSRDFTDCIEQNENTGNTVIPVPLIRGALQIDRSESDTNTLLRPQSIIYSAGKGGKKEIATQTEVHLDEPDVPLMRDVMRSDRMKSTTPSVESLISVIPDTAETKVDNPFGIYADLKFQKKIIRSQPVSTLQGLRNNPDNKPAELLMEGIRDALELERNQQTINYYRTFNDFRDRLLPSDSARRMQVLAQTSTEHGAQNLMQDMKMLQDILAKHPGLEINRENIRSFVAKLKANTNLIQTGKKINPLVVAILEGVEGKNLH